MNLYIDESLTDRGVCKYSLYARVDWRLLEGVMFKAFIENDELSVDTVEEWDKDPYLHKLNKKHWMSAALDFAKKNDIASCPKCGNDVSATPVDA